jgi:[ribosomal protein S5]-alanine N-acetyltransferase
MQALELHTERLRMVPATADLLRLELDNPPTFAAQLEAALPQDWPPGEYDRDAIQFFLEQTISGGDSVVGWYGWYVLLDGKEHGGNLLIGCGGYLGAPDEAGKVEIGYSLCKQWRGEGLAKEMVGALVENAWRRGARTVVAHSDTDNAASIAVLRACGFLPLLDETSEMRLFAINRETSSYGCTMAL